MSAYKKNKPLYNSIIISLIIISAILLQSHFIITKLERERDAKITELEGKVKYLQSRVMLNAKRLDNQEALIFQN